MRTNELQWRGDKLMYFTRNTGVKIIPDAKWAGMYRVEYPNGVVSDMTNLSRAKDAAVYLVTNHFNRTTAGRPRSRAGSE